MALRPLLLLLAALALAGCGAADPEVQPPVAGTTTAAETEAVAPPAGKGPDISGPGLDGEALSVADFRGKPLFVNVWSSW